MAANPKPAFDWQHPDYLPIYQRRTALLQKFRRSKPAEQAAVIQYYRDNPSAFINDFGMTLDPRNPERDLPASVPFVLFPRQVELIDFIMARWRGREPGLIEKSRDIGASWLIMSLAVTLCTFHKGLTIGIGSRKEQLLDNAGDPSSLFFKARMFHQALPPEFRGQMTSAHMRLTFAETGSAIVGEAGDQIGRGARCSLFLLDESAFIERPELIEASLSATTNVRIDVSSVNGLDNPFAQKRHSGKVPTFTFHWKSDPRKDDAWYQKKREELPPHVVASEIDLDYRGSVEGQLIPAAWINAAIDAHVKLGITPSGGRFAGLDVADQGRDDCAFAGRHGVLLNYLRSWSGRESDIFKTTIKTFGLCDELRLASFAFDQDGLGAGVAGDANAINVERTGAGKLAVQAVPFRGSASPLNPDAAMVPGRKNRDFFANAKAQAWWSLRQRFENTFRAIEGKGEPFDPDNIISIDSQLPELLALQMELSQPCFSVSTAGKILIDKAPDGMRSPNLADSVMICFAPQMPAAFFSQAMLGARPDSSPTPAPAEYPLYLNGYFAVVSTSLKVAPAGLGVVYFGVATFGQCSHPLYILDWNIEPLADARLDVWTQAVYERLDQLRALCKFRGPHLGVYTEPSGLGPAIFGQALDAGHVENADLQMVPEPLARLDLAERAAAASRYVAGGKVQMAPAARDKQISYRGLTQNVLTAEILNFNSTAPDESAELAGAFYAGVLIALEDPPRK
jgi:phage terminase large subunit